MSFTKLLVTACAISCFAVTAPVARAEMTCRISMEITKGGFVIGAAGGSGTLQCDDRVYPLEISGLNVGLVIGMSKMSLTGKARNLLEVTDIEGTYAKTGASAAAGSGATNILATNEYGVELVMRGSQVGLEASLDLGGLKIRLLD